MKMRKLVTVLQAVVGLISRKAGQFFFGSIVGHSASFDPFSSVGGRGGH